MTATKTAAKITTTKNKSRINAITMNIRQRLFEAVARLARRLKRKLEREHREAALEGAVRTMDKALNSALRDTDALMRQRREDYLELVSEMAEAAQMAGTGPWQVSSAVVEHTNQLIAAARTAFDTGQPFERPVQLQEGDGPLPIQQGAMGDIELALQNVEWRREINLSWYEFSRWGIQQIMLISRLYYIKNPLIRRLINIAAVYVFGRGVEVTSSDPDANEVLAEFFERNKGTLGQIALCNLERSKYYDGNLFFCFFADKTSSGTVTVRTLDPTEIQEIVSNPEDVAEPWYYKRSWTQRTFNPLDGQFDTDQKDAWYPALNFEPKQKPETINGQQVMWDSPILHRKYGQVGKWKFGCPIIYPALNWAKAASRFLESCATVQQSLATISMLLTSKGGQQALLGAKEQLETTVGPSTAVWDSQPPPVKASIFASGPGTTLEAFNQRGGGADPEKVRQYKLMCCMVADVPETFLADVSTGNLATATTLDRPTELAFGERQEDWREILTTIGIYALKVSLGAPSGKLREALRNRAIVNVKAVVIREGQRVTDSHGRMVYSVEAKKQKDNRVDVMATFPAIREGDLPQMVKAIVEAMTLDNKGGQVTGIDEKIGVGLLLQQLGVENAPDVVEQMYPEGEYEPDRTIEPLPAPISKALPDPGGAPQDPGGHDPAPPQKRTEALIDEVVKLRSLGEKLVNGR